MFKNQNQFQELTKEQQIAVVYGLYRSIALLEYKLGTKMVELDIFTINTSFKQASDDLIKELARALQRKKAKCLVNCSELDGFDEQIRNLQEMHQRLQETLVELFNLPVTLNYSCAIKNQTVHLYASAAGKTPTKDRNHGHYGIDFMRNRAFVRPWGQRQARQKNLQEMSIETFLEIQRNAS